MNEAMLKRALSLRQVEELEKSNQLLLQLVDHHPNDGFVQYQAAWSFDILGKEANAVPHYEQAIKLGLDEGDMQGAIIGLGSTYRTLGRYEESRKLLEDGMSQFPQNGAMKVFYAMSLYNLHDYRGAMEILLKTIADETADDEIHSYKKTIAFYADHLDDMWE